MTALVEVLFTTTVRGTPAPQGSKHARPIYRGSGPNQQFTGKVATVESSDTRVKTWRGDVRAAAETVMESMPGLFPLAGPLVVRLVMSVARPKSHYGTRGLLPSAPKQPSGQPDLSKLARSTEDALGSAGVFKSDAQIVEYARLAKVYIASDPDSLSYPGARIQIGGYREDRRQPLE